MAIGVWVGLLLELDSDLLFVAGDEFARLLIATSIWLATWLWPLRCPPSDVGRFAEQMSARPTARVAQRNISDALLARALSNWQDAAVSSDELQVVDSAGRSGRSP
jgi:hypothetical protein